MKIRKYQEQDLDAIVKLFYDTVHSVNRKDYTEEQVCAWADGRVDTEMWNRSFEEHTTVVAEQEGEIVGFGDMDEKGYLDRLYVHRDYQGLGVGSAICDTLEKTVKAGGLSVHASITARPFFEKRGYHVLEEQQVERGGVLLTNYKMEKQKDEIIC